MQSIDDTQKLFRFISLEDLISIVVLHKESFRSPFVWDDTYEGYMLSKLKCGINRSYLLNSLFTVESQDGLFSAISKYSNIWFATQCLYAQCWTTSESDALWKIYSYGNHAIRICSTKEKIMKTIKQKTHYAVKIDMVEYDVEKGEHLLERQVEQMLFQKDAAEIFFHKRKVYEHEHEVRVVMTTDDFGLFGKLNQMKIAYDSSQFSGSPISREDWLKSAIPFIEDIEKMKVDEDFKSVFIGIERPSEYIESVLVHPDAPSWYLKMIKEICLTLGTEICVAQSDFYK